jgi:ribosomal protein L37E
MEKAPLRCPACGFAVFNRRYPKCESCGAALPDTVIYSASERDALRRADDEADATRRVVDGNKRRADHGFDLPDIGGSADGIVDAGGGD